MPITPKTGSLFHAETHSAGRQHILGLQKLADVRNKLVETVEHIDAIMEDNNFSR
jgi:hypothetical protein